MKNRQTFLVSPTTTSTTKNAPNSNCHCKSCEKFESNIEKGIIRKIIPDFLMLMVRKPDMLGNRLTEYLLSLIQSSTKRTPGAFCRVLQTVKCRNSATVSRGTAFQSVKDRFRVR